MLASKLSTLPNEKTHTHTHTHTYTHTYLYTYKHTIPSKTDGTGWMSLVRDDWQEDSDMEYATEQDEENHEVSADKGGIIN